MMLNFIWGGMVVISFIVAIFTGRISDLTASALSGAASGIETCIGLLGTMCLWTGLAKIAENSGLNQMFAKILRPFTKLLFPKLKKDSAALKAIVLNMVANLLGMGNAATPLGLCAMRELDKENKHKASASNEMCTFAVLNTASIQLIPSTVISLRQMYGALNPSEIVFPVWICSTASVIVGITAAKLFEKYGRNRL